MVRPAPIEIAILRHIGMCATWNTLCYVGKFSINFCKQYPKHSIDHSQNCYSIIVCLLLYSIIDFAQAVTSDGCYEFQNIRKLENYSNEFSVLFN